MFKLSAKLAAVLAIVTALLLIGLQSFTTPALTRGLSSEASSFAELSSLDQPFMVATAAAAPTLVPAILGGKPIHVLYVTRTGDTVLVRCYPGYQPTLTVRAMGGNSGANGQKEGVMTCQPAA